MSGEGYVSDSLGRADTSERRAAMRAYELDGDSRSAHRTSAASMTMVNGPSGAIDKQACRESFVHSMNDTPHLALRCSESIQRDQEMSRHSQALVQSCR